MVVNLPRVPSSITEDSDVLLRYLQTLVEALDQAGVSQSQELQQVSTELQQTVTELAQLTATVQDKEANKFP